MNLVSILHERARRHPDRAAIHDLAAGAGRSITYGELSQRVSRGASFLRAQGLREGDTLLLLHPIGIVLYEALLSVFHAGMTALLIDPGPGRPFMESCCRRRPPDAFFGSRKAHLLRLGVPSLRRTPCTLHPRGWLPFSNPWNPTGPTCEPVPCPADHPALLTFTSGSTGTPKAAARSHAFLIAQFEALDRSLHLQDGDVDLTTLPVFVLANLAAGVTSVLVDLQRVLADPREPAHLRMHCSRLEVTRCTASPALFERLLATPGALPDFRCIHTGGAPVHLDLLDRLQKALPGAEIHGVYGSTEAEPIAEFAVRDLADADRQRSRRGGGLPAGRPVQDLAIRILPNRDGTPLPACSPEEFEHLALPAGEVGEIVVSGPHVLAGYLDAVGDDECKIRVANGVWHRTGDAGCLDRHGMLWLHGRCSARLPSGAYPLAIESALRDLPGRPRTAALPWHGTTLVIQSDHQNAELASLARERTGDLLDHILFLPRIPLDRRHHAKVDYPALLRLLDKSRPR